MAPGWNASSVFMGMLSYGPRRERLKLLDLLGVRAVLIDGRPAQRAAAFQPLISHYELRDSCVVESGEGEVPVALLENRHAMSRASVLFRAITVADMNAAAEVLGRDDFDPARSVVVDVQSNAAGMLLLTDSFDPEWTATVNGRDTPILPADVLFRAVTVDEGTSRVVFEYRATSFRLGAVVTASSVLLAFVLVAFARRTEDPPPRREDRVAANDGAPSPGVAG